VPDGQHPPLNKWGGLDGGNGAFLSRGRVADSPNGGYKIGGEVKSREMASEASDPKLSGELLGPEKGSNGENLFFPLLSPLSSGRGDGGGERGLLAPFGPKKCANTALKRASIHRTSEGFYPNHRWLSPKKGCIGKARKITEKRKDPRY